MDADLIINDDYVVSVGDTCCRRAASLEAILDEYISILKTINDTAIQEGEMSVAVNAYVLCAQQLEGQIQTISSDMKRICNCMIDAVDKADSYLF